MEHSSSEVFIHIERLLAQMVTGVQYRLIVLVLSIDPTVLLQYQQSSVLYIHTQCTTNVAMTTTEHTGQIGLSAGVNTTVTAIRL